LSKRSDDADVPELEDGTTTSERRRRRRRGAGLRVPSDNVPRRTPPQPVVAPVPEDPNLAVSLAYSFGGDGESSTPGVPLTAAARAAAAAAEELGQQLEQLAETLPEGGRTKEMPAVQLEALGLEVPEDLASREDAVEPSGDTEILDVDEMKVRDGDEQPEPDVEPAPPRRVRPRASTVALSDDDLEELVEPMQNRTAGPRSNGQHEPARPPASALEAFDDHSVPSLPTVHFRSSPADSVEIDVDLGREGEERPPTGEHDIALDDDDLQDEVAQPSDAGDSGEILSDELIEEVEAQIAQPVPLRTPEPAPAQPAAKAEAKPEAKAEPKPEAKLEPKPEPKVDAKAEADVENEREVEADETDVEPDEADEDADVEPDVEPDDDNDVEPVDADDEAEASAVAKESERELDKTAEKKAPPIKPPPAPPPAKKPNAAQAAAVAAAVAPPDVDAREEKKRRAKPWFEEIFDEDYLRTLPFLTPQATQGEAQFVIDSLGLHPGAQVLDLGCGYGRHAMELAARGFHVVGLDLSLPLLLRGADEAQRRGLTINFVHGDMRELDFDSQFDGAYCVFSTFGYFDDETNKKTATNLARALKPGAKVVIDILNRDYLISDLPTRVWWEGDGCVVLEEVEFNYFSSRIQTNRSVVFDDGRQVEQEISMRAYSLHEIGKLLHAAGFRVLEISGSMATRGRFFGGTSRQIIVVAERRPKDSAPPQGSGPASGA